VSSCGWLILVKHGLQGSMLASYAQGPDRTKELDMLLDEHAVAKDWAAAVLAAVQLERRR
jgi:hypothetical protein